jgi:hypothetical protein
MAITPVITAAANRVTPRRHRHPATARRITALPSRRLPTRRRNSSGPNASPTCQYFASAKDSRKRTAAGRKASAAAAATGAACRRTFSRQMRPRSSQAFLSLVSSLTGGTGNYYFITEKIGFAVIHGKATSAHASYNLLQRLVFFFQ